MREGQPVGCGPELHPKRAQAECGRSELGDFKADFSGRVTKRKGMAFRSLTNFHYV